MAAKVRPALLLTGSPADDELDVVTVLLHTTPLRGNRWELNIPKPFLKPGAFHLQQVQTVSNHQARTQAWLADRGRNETYVDGTERSTGIGKPEATLSREGVRTPQGPTVRTSCSV